MRGSLVTAKATILAALWRQESRGAHQREDFQETDPGFLRNHRVSWSGGGLKESEVPAPPIPDALKKYISEDELEIDGRLLE